MKISVLGAGTWGTALARLLANRDHEVMVWSALPQEVLELSEKRVHKNLPGMVIPESIRFTAEAEEACREAEMLVMAVPSVFNRSTTRLIAPYYREEQIIVNVSKGIEVDTLMTMTQVIRDELEKAAGVKNPKIAALSGPTHAEEVSRDLPTTIVAACQDQQVAEQVQDAFMTPKFRVYTNTDIEGVELCGAMKNIIALACGMLTGLGYGDNTRAALMTRGMAEITRIGIKMGCSPHTFYGLAGIGDLIVTATSQFSRNNRCGYLIGQGKDVQEAIREVGMVVEGINALPAAVRLAEKYDSEMPIVSAVAEVVNNGADPEEAVGSLMVRDRKSEDLV